MMPLVQKLIKQRKKEWSPAMVEDPVQESLLAMIAEKKKTLRPVKKGKPAPSPATQPGSNVFNIMDTLRRSIEANGSSGKRA
jgi:DNA end-binding protein Ku